MSFGRLTTPQMLELLKQLAAGCPHGEGCEPDCVMRGVRMLPVRDQIDFINSLPDHELTRAASLHEQCLRHQAASACSTSSD